MSREAKSVKSFQYTKNETMAGSSALGQYVVRQLFAWLFWKLILKQASSWLLELFATRSDNDLSKIIFAFVVKIEAKFSVHNNRFKYLKCRPSKYFNTIYTQH